MKTKRGQITVFIIIGVLIVVSAGILYYISPPEEIEVEELDVTPIKEYITSCLDSKTKEALLLIGKQGGYIYPATGLRSYPVFEGENIYNIYYGITKPYLINTTVWNVLSTIYIPLAYAAQNPFPAPPKYPWEEFPAEGADTLKPGLFGITHLPSLIYGDSSIKSQLEKHLSQNITECLNLSIFKEQGFEIKEGVHNISVTIGLGSVAAELTYPLEIKKAEQKVDLEKFSININVRFGKLFSFIRELVLKDVSIITFDINASANNYGGFFVTKISYDEILDDLIIISDSGSSLYGKPYEFRFMRQNRHPAADPSLQVGHLFKLNENYFDPDEDKPQEMYFGPTECNGLEPCICDQGGLCDSPS